MKTRDITVKIPDFLPTKRTLGYIWNTLKFKFFPYRCKECGVRLDFDSVETEHQSPGKLRVILSFHDCICHRCLSNNIKKYFQQRIIGDLTSCHCCSENKQTIQGTGVGIDNKNIDLQKELGLYSPRLILGGAWWNGHNICEDCIIETLEYGVPKSSLLVSFGKTTDGHWNMFYSNRKGALFDFKRKHWFFK